MTMFIKIENGAPVGNPIFEENFRQAFPEIALPPLVTPADIEPHGYGLYDFSNQPTPGRYQKVIEVTPVKNDVGVWKQTWALVDKTDAEKAEEDAAMAAAVRNQRLAYLFQSDWVVIKAFETGTAIPAEWVAYRQALRDVPQQAGFPWNVVWPTQP
jgi:Phage tail assembly chaperone protein